MNLCRLNYSVGDALLGQLQRTHTPPLLPPTWAPDKSGTKEGKGQRPPELGTGGPGCGKTGLAAFGGDQGWRSLWSPLSHLRRSEPMFTFTLTL